MHNWATSNVLWYFGTMRCCSAALHALAEAKLAWYSPSSTHMIWNYIIRPSWLCSIGKVLATRPKFLKSSGYRIQINCHFTFRATNIFCFFLRCCQSSFNWGSLSSRIRRCCKFISEAFTNHTEWSIAQSAEAVEYTDCTSAEE